MNDIFNEFNWVTIEHYMCPEICEELHNNITPCSPQVFFDAYVIAHRKKYGEDFEIN